MDDGQALMVLVQRQETAETFPRKRMDMPGAEPRPFSPRVVQDRTALSEATRRSHRIASTSNGRGCLFRDARW
jgi:hypothetical protein